MKRAERLASFRDGLEISERDHRSRLAAAEAKVGEARLRLDELQRYREEYLRSLGARTAGGIGANALRDFHAFVARIGDAVLQQAQMLARSELECEFERQHWHDAATRRRAVASVVERWREEDRRAGDRTEQRQSDEWARLIGHGTNLENP